jgi:hypothetical protein
MKVGIAADHGGFGPKPMKRNIVFKSLDDISPEVFEPEPDRPAPDYLELIPASLQEPRHVPLPILESGHSGFAAYPHWGLNE